MENYRTFALMTLPFVLALILAEAAYLIWVRGERYDWREALASTAVAIGHRLTALMATGIFGGLIAWLWHQRLFTVDLHRGRNWLLLFVAVEFVYYWYHRASHGCHWLWATHAVHHSPRQMNLSSAYRLGWTAPLSGAFVFFAPLIWLGFDPKAVFGMLAFNLLYQFWLHTEVVPGLPFLDRIFNTPSNHRVHHGMNARYLDSNFGGVLIVFDRLFGSYVAEAADEPVRYGLAHAADNPGADSKNPLLIVFGQWLTMARSVAHSRNWREAFGYLFGPPAWRPARSTDFDTNPTRTPSCVKH